MKISRITVYQFSGVGRFEGGAGCGVGDTYMQLGVKNRSFEHNDQFKCLHSCVVKPNQQSLVQIKYEICFSDLRTSNDIMYALAGPVEIPQLACVCYIATLEAC